MASKSVELPTRLGSSKHACLTRSRCCCCFAPARSLRRRCTRSKRSVRLDAIENGGQHAMLRVRHCVPRGQHDKPWRFFASSRKDKGPVVAGKLPDSERADRQAQLQEKRRTIGELARGSNSRPESRGAGRQGRHHPRLETLRCPLPSDGGVLGSALHDIAEPRGDSLHIGCVRTSLPHCMHCSRNYMLPPS